MKTNEVSTVEAAKRLGLTNQAIGQWASKPGAPVRKAGNRVYIAWPAFARWREQELVRQGQTEATAAMRKQLDAVQGGDPMARKLKADARKAEIEVELLEGTVVRVEEAAAVAEQLLTNIRATLIPFPRTAAPKLLGAKSIIELETALDKEVRRLMEILSGPSLDMTPPKPADAA